VGDVRNPIFLFRQIEHPPEENRASVDRASLGTLILALFDELTDGSGIDIHRFLALEKFVKVVELKDSGHLNAIIGEAIDSSHLVIADEHCPVGCVDYRLSFDPEHHQTGYAFLMGPSPVQQSPRGFNVMYAFTSLSNPQTDAI
jgi:hypothetical protein